MNWKHFRLKLIKQKNMTWAWNMEREKNTHHCTIVKSVFYKKGFLNLNWICAYLVHVWLIDFHQLHYYILLFTLCMFIDYKISFSFDPSSYIQGAVYVIQTHIIQPNGKLSYNFLASFHGNQAWRTAVCRRRRHSVSVYL